MVFEFSPCKPCNQGFKPQKLVSVIKWSFIVSLVSCIRYDITRSEILTTYQQNIDNISIDI